MTLQQITEICHGTYVGDKEIATREIQGVVIDSRQVDKDYLFVAIRGEKVDGHKFIPNVFLQGAAAALSEEKIDYPAGPYILVESCLQSLKDLAEYYRKHLDIKVVGVTGSVGKTSTKEMIASVLGEKYKVCKTEGNFNNEIGLPLTILKIREEHQVAVLEMGISEFGEMHRLAAMAYPDVCVITNIGLCHLENLITRDGILKAKTESFDHIKEGGIAVLNGDDDKLATIPMVNGKRPVFYGINREALSEYTTEKTVYATEVVNFGLKGMKAKIHVADELFEVTIPIPGEHNVYNALAATSVGIRLGLTIDEIKSGIESAGTICGRTNMIEVRGMIVIDDCYNANPVSMKASLDVLSTAEGDKIAVLGDMGELGEDELQLHYSIGTYLAKKNIDAVFCVGKLSKEIARAITEHSDTCKVFYFEERETMIQALLPYLKFGDTILVKASHFMNFSKVVEEICATYK